MRPPRRRGPSRRRSRRAPPSTRSGAQPAPAAQPPRPAAAAVSRSGHHTTRGRLKTSPSRSPRRSARGSGAAGQRERERRRCRRRRRCRPHPLRAAARTSITHSSRGRRGGCRGRRRAAVGAAARGCRQRPRRHYRRRPTISSSKNDRLSMLGFLLADAVPPHRLQQPRQLLSRL